MILNLVGVHDYLNCTGVGESIMMDVPSLLLCLGKGKGIANSEGARMAIVSLSPLVSW